MIHIYKKYIMIQDILCLLAVLKNYITISNSIVIKKFLGKILKYGKVTKSHTQHIVL